MDDLEDLDDLAIKNEIDNITKRINTIVKKLEEMTPNPTDQSDPVNSLKPHQNTESE